MEKNRTQMPSPKERELAVRRIVDEAFTKEIHVAYVPLRTIFFGVGDCFAAGTAAAILCFVTIFFFARSETLAPLLFFSSPVLYASVCAFTKLKDAQLGITDWRRTCRIPENALAGMRMLVSGALCILLIVPADLLLSRGMPEHFDPLWMTGLSFSSLFLYALVNLWMMKFRYGTAASVGVWCGVSVFLTACGPAAAFLMSVPAAALYILVAGAACVFFFRVRHIFFTPHQTEASYAYNF